ncbi:MULTISPECIES: tripartite tricarboxylate transporter permease [Agrobacterium]|jgi:putative tricarboxylic transport membrane protein|uniref:Tripartite tricarboxylate transporter permease n=1 Tax=Agrobacterium salinitolerans TaxID=1183413 RepID=A0ABY3BMB7_9HYPH|nr:MULTISPECIES: tripartite tricarboxylate transporter permease [Agrobacterium]MBA4774438.1 tripartite tricarboxylate transporter permease [Hyphomicrobiales bacterium]MCZ7853503.1 tripartite tricarboxylate transporter permease [Agrobacterium salinitolerans]MCZ7858838.1 tripartite tricarboxylate transporter permease [Agrobacterium salinitolerans]MCZ7862052.1 tripartite tricarboxylate transporter permease [Agrobacterium salinitolerans]MCZ7886323.1 tripartite tricarboxylate transporter permease [
MNFDYLWHGFAVALTGQNLLIGFIGCFIGTMVGALPAIGPINGIALLMPIAYSMGLPAESTMILLAAVYCGAEYGGRISSILLNVPGDAGAVMTAMDGYPMARQGRAGEALALSGISSFVGGIIGSIGLALFAPVLSGLAIGFGPAEYFVLMVFAFATLGSMVGSQPTKTLIGCMLGLMLATVGLDATSGAYRFTFNEPELGDGIEFVVLVIGLFSISEAMLILEHQGRGVTVIRELGRTTARWADVVKSAGATVRGSLIGFVVGVLPGTGASVSSAVSYTTEKRISDSEGTFGKGDVRGLAAPEAANNATAAGAFVPMLTLGVPGSGTTAVMLGALMLYNIQPGPMLLAERPEVVGGLIASLFVGNFILLALNLPLVNIFARVLTVPNWLLVPGILVLSIVGVYSTHASVFSIVLMLAIGFLGWLLRKVGFDMAPIILGFVLGRVMEVNLRNALAISGGDVSILFSSTISIVLWCMAAGVAILPLVLARRARRIKAMALAKE